MMMTTIPSPHLMRTDTKRAKNKERSERISSSVFNRTQTTTINICAKRRKKTSVGKRGTNKKTIKLDWISRTSIVSCPSSAPNSAAYYQSRCYLHSRPSLASLAPSSGCVRRQSHHHLRRSSSFLTTTLPLFGLFLFLSFKIEEETISLFSFKTLWSWQQTTTFIRGSIVLSLRWWYF